MKRRIVGCILCCIIKIFSIRLGFVERIFFIFIVTPFFFKFIIALLFFFLRRKKKFGERVMHVLWWYDVTVVIRCHVLSCKNIFGVFNWKNIFSSNWHIETFFQSYSRENTVKFNILNQVTTCTFCNTKNACCVKNFLGVHSFGL